MLQRKYGTNKAYRGCNLDCCGSEFIVGKASGAALILAGVAILASAYMLPRGAKPEDHGPAPVQGSDVANPPSGPLARGTWRLYGTKPEDPVVVTLPSHTRETPPQQNEPVIPRDKAALARELQSELKRVGCYGGEINGVWSASTRQAIKAFIDRVNATLPTEEPDSILLTLVRSYPGKVCGEPCPTGQRVAEGDRCVLMALAAQPKKQPSPQSAPGLITDWTTRTTVARAPLIDQGEGAMALAGPTEVAPPAPTASAGPPPLPFARKPVANHNRFGPQIFRKLDRLGAN